MTNQTLDIPPAWEKIELPASGVVMVIGAPDTGKSTFAHYLYRRLCVESRHVAFLDGDPGQSTLGPPATMTVALGTRGDDTFPPRGRYWRRFVQAISPRRHMLPVLVNAARLTQAAREAAAKVGTGVILYDTTGLVDPTQGGANLKLAKIELLQPCAVLAIQRHQELEATLAPLRHNRHIRLIELQPSSAVQPRDVTTRQAYRASQFAQYFASARTLTIDWGRLPVLPTVRFAFHQLVALEDDDGFTLDLGIVRSADIKSKQVTLLTPLASLAGVEALRLGAVTLDPKTFRDEPLM